MFNQKFHETFENRMIDRIICRMIFKELDMIK